jgi:hypothetical protein
LVVDVVEKGANFILIELFTVLTLYREGILEVVTAFGLQVGIALNVVVDVDKKEVQLF